MNIHDQIFMGHDNFKLVKVPVEGSGLGYIYRFVIAPRSDQYQSWFRHNEHIRIFSLTGALQLDINGQASRIEKEQFVDIEPGDFYRFRGLEYEPVQGYVFAASSEVTASWEQTAQDLKQRSVIERNGQARYR